MAIYSSDGEVYDTPLHHELDMSQADLAPPEDAEGKRTNSDSSVGTPVTSKKDKELSDTMTHSKAQSGPLQTPLLQQLSDKLLETNKTIGDLMTGRLDPSSEEGIHKVTDLAMRTVGYGMLGAEKDAFGIFGGRMSAAARFTAEQFEKRGMPDEQIKRWTGLERGAEGMWRKEIADANMKVKIPTEKIMEFEDPHNGEFTFTGMGTYLKEGTYRLDEIMEHPDFFKAYPELKSRPVYVLHHPERSARGWYSADDRSITVNAAHIRDNEDAKNNLVHELQHMIQHEEGFALGHYEGFDKQALSAAAKKEPSERTEKDMEAIKAYLNQSHEVEARNAESRMHLTREEIARSLGKDTEDVDRLEQHIRPLSNDDNLNQIVTNKHLESPEAAKFRLGQLERDKSATKKRGGDVEGQEYAPYNVAIRKLREYLKDKK